MSEPAPELLTKIRGSGGEVASPKHLHLMIQKAVEEHVIATLGAHDALPSERHLAERFGVSRMTVRHAIDALVRSGLLYRVQGSGTYVSEAGRIKGPVGIASFTEDMKARGLNPSSELIDIVIRSARENHALSEALNLRPMDPTITIRRLRLADGTVMAYECVVLPLARVPGIADEDLTGSLYEILEKKYSLRIERMQQRIRAVSLPEREARYLNTLPGEPGLSSERVGYDRSGVPLERALTIYKADRYELELSLIDERD